MMPLVVKCTKCGALDTRKTYRTADEAAADGAFERWTCSTCAWTEFDLVSEDQEAATTAR